MADNLVSGTNFQLITLFKNSVHGVTNASDVLSFFRVLLLSTFMTKKHAAGM